jgi:hypothetical protein
MMLLHSKTAAPCFGIRHTQETSVHQWSTHPPTKRHPTAARQNSLLYINSIETLICHGISKKKQKTKKNRRHVELIHTARKKKIKKYLPLIAKLVVRRRMQLVTITAQQLLPFRRWPLD